MCYENYYCFATDEADDCVYEFDLEEGGLVLVWKTFGKLINEIVANGEEEVRLGYYD